VDQIALAQDTDGRRDLVNAVMNLQLLYNAEKFWTSSGANGYSRMTLLHTVSERVSEVVVCVTYLTYPIYYLLKIRILIPLH